MMVVSRDGYALWARSSDPALRSGRFIRTSGDPHELPPQSPAARGDFSAEARSGIVHASGAWFDEEVEELTIHARNHDQAITVLHMGAPRPKWTSIDEEQEPDVVDRLVG